MGSILPFLLVQEDTDWIAAHESATTPWGWVSVAIAAIGALVFAALLVRALLRASRYRAVSVLTPADVERVREAIVAAEKRTVGEIGVVVLERSDTHPQARWIAALSAMLIGLALLAPLLPWHEPLLLVLVQLGFGAVGYALAHGLPDFRRAFIAEDRATAMAQKQAVIEFQECGLHATAERTGVLIFVSLLEHRVVVLGDAGIHARVTEDTWAAVDRAILDGVVEDRLADGLVHGIERAGDFLHEHFPWREGDRNEVPEHVIVRKE